MVDAAVSKTVGHNARGSSTLPFGTINYNQDSGKVIKCDLCGGDPACATACPTGAITFVDSNWTGLDKMKQWAEKLSNTAHA